MSEDMKILLPWIFLFALSFSPLGLLEEGDIQFRWTLFMIIGLVWMGIGFPVVIVLQRQFGFGWRFWKGTQYQAKAFLVPLTVALCGLVLAGYSFVALINQNKCFIISI